MQSTNVLLSTKTTTGIGGLVKYFFEPNSILELQECLQFIKSNKLPYYLLAGGSNTIFADDDLDPNQAVVSMMGFDKFEFENNQLEIGSGMSLQLVVDFYLDLGFAGATGLNRIPGTLGGAVVGNAGAYGAETAGIVAWVEVLDIQTLEIIRLNAKDCGFGYRTSVFKQRPNWIVIKIGLKTEPIVDLEAEKQKYQEIATKRDAVYPAGLLSPGSVFKNIYFDQLDPKIQVNIPSEWVVFGNKLPAGKLLEEVGAKGLRFGGVGMRDTHANILINYGRGKYADVVGLITELQNRVMAKFGITLEPEIRVVPAKFDQK